MICFRGIHKGMNDSRGTMVQTKLRDSVSPTILVSEVKMVEEKMDVLDFFLNSIPIKENVFFGRILLGKICL